MQNSAPFLTILLLLLMACVNLAGALLQAGLSGSRLLHSYPLTPVVVTQTAGIVAFPFAYTAAGTVMITIAVLYTGGRITVMPFAPAMTRSRDRLTVTVAAAGAGVDCHTVRCAGGFLRYTALIVMSKWRNYIAVV